MKILHLKQSDFVTTAWSGGTTTQLLIWPEGADYAARQFQVRISSAVVALEESDFTALPGVLRYITPLQGGFTLTHPGKPGIEMGPLAEPYRFSGEEITHCVGKATDFNLMLKGVEGEMTLATGEVALRPGLNGFYAPHNSVYRVNGEEYSLAAGEMLVVWAETAGTICLGHDLSLRCFAAV